MKKLAISVAILALFSQNLLACGDCRDTPLELIKTTHALATYNKEENEIAKQILELNEYFKKEIIEIEKLNLAENQNLNALVKHKSLLKQNELFLLEQQNQVQSILNNIEGE